MKVSKQAVQFANGSLDTAYNGILKKTSYGDIKVKFG